MQADVIRAFAGERLRERARGQRPRAGRAPATTWCRATTAATSSSAAPAATASARANADDVVWGGSGDDAVYGGEGPDELHGGSGERHGRRRPGRRPPLGRPGGRRRPRRAGDDTLHALAADGDADTLDCGPGRDTAQGARLRALDDDVPGLRDRRRRGHADGRRRGCRGGSRRGRGVAGCAVSARWASA